MTHTPPPDTIIRTETDLAELWRRLMGPGGFGRRSLWHVFLDAEVRSNRVIVPIDDIPAEPDELLVDNLAHVMREVTAGGSDASVAVLLSRPGPGHMTGQDRSWARAVRRAFGPTLCPWPMHLATRDRVQVFAPDDLIVG